jgi:hypothetical protein
MPFLAFASVFKRA